MSTTASEARAHFDVAVLGGGSAAEALCRELDGTGRSIVVFEPDLVGGECPFRACMPSKSMLRDAQRSRGWESAIERRDEIVHHRNDSEHAEQLADLGVELVRRHATIVDPTTVAAGALEYTVDHIVVATGASPRTLEVPGADECSTAIWTSADALTSNARPDRLLVVGGGVIGVECATIFAGLGSDVVLVHPANRLMEDAAPPVSEILESALTDGGGVDVRLGTEVGSLQQAGDAVSAQLADGSEVEVDRVLVAIGRLPNSAGLGLERLGVEGEEPLPYQENGSLDCEGSIWAIGDVSGHGEYTHLANHHARVVADHIAGSATRHYDDVVQVGCVFTDPPIVQVGRSWAELTDIDDIVTSERSLGSFPRATTDELGDGYLWLAASRSSGCLVAASGIGASFDEVVHALVVAIDGAVPVCRLQQSMQPFPTIGEILGPLFRDLHEQLTAAHRR